MLDFNDCAGMGLCLSLIAIALYSKYTVSYGKYQGSGMGFWWMYDHIARRIIAFPLYLIDKEWENRDYTIETDPTPLFAIWTGIIIIAEGYIIYYAQNLINFIAFLFYKKR